MPNADKQPLDPDGYRKNVGIIICNDNRQVLWARRIRHDGWQFPQGGIRRDESALDAAFRELQEEVGLQQQDVDLLGVTDDWIRYEVPYADKIKHRSRFRGQKQRWFLFRLTAQESRVRLDVSSTPEFDQWRWIDYWRPLQQIVEFKKPAYKKALTELAPLIFPQ